MKNVDHLVTNAPVENYALVRDRIRTGDVLLCSGTSPFSRLIKAGTKSDWSHVAFVRWDNEIDRLMVMESVETVGVRTVPLSKYLVNYDGKGGTYPGGLVVLRHKDFDPTLENMAALGSFAVDRIGTPYDTGEIVRITYRVARAMLGAEADPDEILKHDKLDICSEFVDRCMRQFGIRIQSSGYGYIAPADYAKDPKFDLVAVLRENP